MSWIVRDPPSPFADSSPKLEDKSPKLGGNIPASSPTPEAVPPFYSFPPPPLRLDLVEEQWSTNPLQIKSIFSPVGAGIQSVTSSACGMGWSLNLSPDLPGSDSFPPWGLKNVAKQPVRRPKNDINTVRMRASLQSSSAGFQPGTISIRVSFRRGVCVLAVLNTGQQNLLKGQSAISLGRCNIPLPLYELFIDVDVTVFLQSRPVEDSQKLSASMTKAIKASLDGDFPVDVKFMLFSCKSGGTSVCRRRPIYASSSILKGCNSFLDSYMDGSRDGDDLPSTGVYQYPYDEDSDLESDTDEDTPFDVPEISDLTAREPQPDPLSHPLFPVNITDLDTAQSMPPESPCSKILPVASIFDVASDSSPFSVISCEHSPAEGPGSPLRSGTPDSIRMSEYINAELPVCDVKVDGSTGRFAGDYLVDTVNPRKEVSAPILRGHEPRLTNGPRTTSLACQPPVGRPGCTQPHQTFHNKNKKVSAPLRLALINDVAFRTFRALMIYMYTEEAAFTPLKSSGGRSYNVGDTCSPKSMYRLAAKAGHEGLKKHAFDNLRSQLTPQNIITEIFSKFTAEYPEIFEMELTVLLDHFTDPAVRDEWERMIDTVVSGHLPCGADILKKVTRALRTD